MATTVTVQERAAGELDRLEAIIRAVKESFAAGRYIEANTIVQRIGEHVNQATHEFEIDSLMELATEQANEQVLAAGGVDPGFED